MEPMLLEDYTVDKLPQSIRNLLDYFDKENFTPNECDIFVGFLYILMLESGFITVEDKAYENDAFHFHYQRVLALSKRLPKKWKRTKKYRILFVLPGCPLNVCKMVFTPTDNVLLIKSSVKTIKDAKFCLEFDPKIYVPNTKFYKNLRDLSTIFKSDMSYKIKCCILSLSDFRFNHICLLPYEVRERISLHLDFKSSVRVRLVCKCLNEVLDSDKILVRFWRDPEFCACRQME